MLASAKFEQFCRFYFIEPILCPVHDHPGEGKAKRFIRPTKEDLPTKRLFILERTSKRHSDSLYPLQTKKFMKERPCRSSWMYDAS